VFATWLLHLPLLWGWTFGAMLHETLHRPLGLMLPHASRRLGSGHLGITAVAALVFGSVAHRAVPSMPLPLAVMFAATIFSWPLPFEPGGRWAGSRSAAWIAGLALLAALADPGRLRHAMEAAPLAASLGAVAVATLLLVAALSPARRRWRALTPHTSYFNAFFSSPLMRRRSAQNLSRKDFSRASWKTRARPGTVRWWLAALRYERTQDWGSFGWLGTLALGSVVALILPAIKSATQSDLAAGVLGVIGHPAGGALGGTSMVLMLQALLAAVPRSGILYPISRSSRTRITFIGSAVQIGAGYAVFGITTLIIGHTASLLVGQPFPWSGFAQLLSLVSTTLVFAPIVLGARMYQELTDSSHGLVLSVVAMMVFISPARRWLWGDPEKWAGGFVPLDRVAVCILLIALTQGIYYLALRHFHAGDLVRRGNAGPGLDLA
jgi:hypothetical protein